MVEGCPGPPSGSDWKNYLAVFMAAHTEAGIEATTMLHRQAMASFVRIHHHERSEAYVRTAWESLGLRASPTPLEGEIVGRIALGHRKVDLADQTLFGDIPFGTGNHPIRRRLLAAYLRLADELDTTAHRTPWAEYEILDIQDIVSILEWRKHLALFGAQKGPDCFILAGRCDDYDVYVRLLHVQHEIQEKLLDAKWKIGNPYVSSSGDIIRDPLPYSIVRLDVEPIGFLPIELKFELSHDDILRLLMGERLYSDRLVSVRELLQNASDSCRYASEGHPSSWDAEIKVKIDRENNWLDVEDNGIGMSEYIIREYFTKVGKSYYRSNEFTGNFIPTSEFGIGILSCFMIANRIEVDTKHDDFQAIALEIRDLSKPFIPRVGNRSMAGTRIRLILKPGAMNRISLVPLIRKFVKHLEFPIQIVDGELEHTLRDSGLIPSSDDVDSIVSLGHIDDTITEEDRNAFVSVAAKHNVQRSDEGIRVGVTFLDSLLQMTPLRRFDGPARYSAGGMLSQDGFFVRSLENWRGRWIGRRTWTEVDFHGAEKQKLSLGRNDFMDVSQAIVQRIENLYSECVEETTYLQFYSKAIRIGGATISGTMMTICPKFLIDLG
jgi:Histidine kinase-, DNA gyrase B-, and HSP90-like ATPase